MSEAADGRSREVGSLRRRAARLAGEFVIIVLGVLVALAVDEWREVRAERARETAYYRAIVLDLDRELDEYDFALGFVGTSIEAARDVMALVEGRDRPEGAGSLAESVRRASWVNYPAWSMATLDELLGSGSIRLLRDPALKRELLAYRDFVNEWKPRLQGPEFQTFLEYRRHTRGWRPLTDGEEPAPEELAALDRDLAGRLSGDPEIWGIVRGMIGEWATLVDILEQQRAMAESLRERVAGAVGDAG